MTTFYDLFLLLSPLKNTPTLAPVQCQELVALLDSPTLTLHAKKMLNDFLTRYTKRVHDESARSQTILTLKDHGKSVRAHLHTILTVELPLEDRLQHTWDVLRCEGVLAYQEQPKAANVVLQKTTTFLITLTDAGEGLIVFQDNNKRAKVGTPKQLLKLHIISE